MQDHRGDRQSRMPYSYAKAPPKKDGSGGTYTWGGAMDVPSDYSPTGQQGAPKVSTDFEQTQSNQGPVASLNELGVKLESHQQFPSLSSPRSPIAAAMGKASEAVGMARGKASEAMGAASGRATQAVGAAQETVGGLWAKTLTFVNGVRQRAADTVQYAQDQATTRIREPIAERLTALMAQAKDTRAFLFETVIATHASIKDQGLKTWTVEAVQLAASTARVAFGRARVEGAEVVSATRARAVEKVAQSRQAASDAVAKAQVKAIELADNTRTAASEAAAMAQVKGSQAVATAKEVAMDKSFQSTAASAAGGAVALGSAGGATGLAAGTTIGAVVGLVPAVFTFGLSIPIGAIIGGGTGLVAGAAAGTTVGALGGGAAGYNVYKRKDDIAGVASQTMAKVSDSKAYVRGRACASADYVREKASVVRARLVGGGTGSTEDM